MHHDRRRILLWTLAGATLLVFVAAPTAWPGWVVERLDHCPELGCDFVHHYLAQARALRGELVYGWVYPPLLALVLQPFAALADAQALAVWMLLQAAAVAILWLACRRALAGCGRWTSAVGAVALVLPSLPLLHALKWGQVSTFIVAASVCVLSRAPGRATGWVLGGLAALKIYPLVYLGLPALRRQWRVVVVGIGSALLLGVLVPLAVLGPETTRRYFASVWAVKWNHVGYLGGQALWPTLVRLFVTGRHAGVEPEGRAPLLVSLGPVGTSSLAALARTALLFLPAIAVALVTLRDLWRSAARSRTDVERARGDALARDCALLLCATALCLAPGWHHYFAFLPVALAVVLGRSERDSVSLVLCVLAWLATALPVFGLAIGPGSYFHASQWGTTTWAALLVWWALLRGRERT